jgi:hypothetical protein
MSIFSNTHPDDFKIPVVVDNKRDINKIIYKLTDLDFDRIEELYNDFIKKQKTYIYTTNLILL